MFCNLFECIILLVGNTMLFQECVPCGLHFMSEDLHGKCVKCLAIHQAHAALNGSGSCMHCEIFKSTLEAFKKSSLPTFFSRKVGDWLHPITRAKALWVLFSLSHWSMLTLFHRLNLLIMMLLLCPSPEAWDMVSG